MSHHPYEGLVLLERVWGHSSASVNYSDVPGRREACGTKKNLTELNATVGVMSNQWVGNRWYRTHLREKQYWCIMMVSLW